MRIVHAAHYSLTRDGSTFFNCEFKFHTGLCQAGHYVYPFSINDRARWNLFKSKNFGKGFANRALIECCRNIEPDLLLLGHAQYITPETLAELRRRHPLMKIALWYVDPLHLTEDTQHLFPKLKYLDALFTITGGELLAELNRDGCRAFYIPSPADANVERLEIDRKGVPEFDVIYYGSDKGRPHRKAFLETFRGAAERAGLRVGFAGCLGFPPVWGDAKDAFLRKSLVALNLSDKNDVHLFSGDRIVQLAGNGFCTLTDAGTNLDCLYKPDYEMLFYRTLDDLIEKVIQLRQDPAMARKIGLAAREKTHRDFSGKKISEFMCEAVSGQVLTERYAWPIPARE